MAPNPICRVVAARVTSVRAVEWADSRAGGFMFVFRPGPLDQSPQTFIAPLKGPEGIRARTQFQHELVARFPGARRADGLSGARGIGTGVYVTDPDGNTLELRVYG